MQVEIDALKQVPEVEDAITATLEDFDLVVEPFDETAVLTLDEIIADFLRPGIQQFQEMIKTMPAAFLDLADPGSELCLGLFLGKAPVKDSR